MKKILFSLMAVLLSLGLMGAAFAQFSDTETSLGNTFTAGTIDLAVDGENPWTGEVATFTGIKPSQKLAPITINFKNVGNNPGILSLDCDIVEADKYVGDEPSSTTFEFTSLGNPGMEMDADGFASLIYVKEFLYTGAGAYGSILAWLVLQADNNLDGMVSLYELCQKTWTFDYDHIAPTSNPLPADATATIVITPHLGCSLEPWEVGGKILTGVVDNRPQADGVNITITATLNQVP